MHLNNWKWFIIENLFFLQYFKVIVATKMKMVEKWYTGTLYELFRSSFYMHLSILQFSKWTFVKLSNNTRHHATLCTVFVIIGCYISELGGLFHCYVVFIRCWRLVWATLSAGLVCFNLVDFKLKLSAFGKTIRRLKLNLWNKVRRLDHNIV